MLVVRIQLADSSATKRISFDKQEISIGRDEELNDIAIGELSVSKTHAILARTPNGVVLTDLGSTNGTQVNGTLIMKSANIRDNDVIVIGGARLWVEVTPVRGPMRTYDLESGDSETSAFMSASRGAEDDDEDEPDPSGPLLPVLHDDEPLHTFSGSSHMSDTTSASGSAAPPRAEWLEPASEDERQALVLGVASLIDRVAKTTDVERFTRLTRPDAEMIKTLGVALNAQVKAIAHVPEPFADRVVEAARRELVEFGPLGPWLEDPDISEIHCLRHDDIELVMKGRAVTSGLAFSSEAALLRAVLRLARRSGQDIAKGEVTVERRLPNGARLVCFLPPMATTTTLSIRKREAIQRTMTDLVEGRSLSHDMGVFLARSMRARLNLVVCGHAERAVLDVIAALAGSTPERRRIAVLHDGAEVRIARRKTTALALPLDAREEDAAVRAAMQVRYDHTIVTSSSARVSACAVRGIAAGGSGVVVGLRARTLQQAIGVTSAELMLARPGLPLHAAATLVGSALEIGVEVDTAPDGGPRVVRIAEIEPPAAVAPTYTIRDLFVYTDGTSGGSGFLATGAPTRLTDAASDQDE